MSDLLSKLQGDGANSLAALSVDHLLAQPMETLLPPATARANVRRGLEAMVESDSALDALTRVTEALVNELQKDRRALKELSTRDVKQTIHEMLRRPYSPDRKLVLTVIDREPTRKLIRAIVVSTVNEFASRAAAPVAGITRGLGSLAKFAGDTVKSRGGMLGAVVGGVEKQVEQRSLEFADSVLSKIFGQIADTISDPDKADEAADLRAEIFDGVMELTLPQLARELVNLDVTGGAQLLRDGMKRWLKSPDSETLLERATTFILSLDMKRPARDVLSELGLLDVVRTTSIEQLARHIREIAATPAFAVWLNS